jgi:hypothetical protein
MERRRMKGFVGVGSYVKEEQNQPTRRVLHRIPVPVRDVMGGTESTASFNTYAFSTTYLVDGGRTPGRECDGRTALKSTRLRYYRSTFSNCHPVRHTPCSRSRFPRALSLTSGLPTHSVVGGMEHPDRPHNVSSITRVTSHITHYTSQITPPIDAIKYQLLLLLMAYIEYA